jgi:transforming growth factor-beta-induced protein
LTSFHTLPEVTYSNFLQDGQVFKSLAGLPVTVRIVQGSIYFNDAKVVSPNVM